MPKVTDKGHKISYPPGCKPLDEDISKDELVKRLKLLARAFQDMGQDEHSEYKQVALCLATEMYMDHSSKDVRLLVACCIADIFRIFAPEAPFTEPDHLKEIFMFLTQQLRGLEDPESPSFKRYFYLLENLAWVKSFNICLELEDNQEIFCSLFKLMFTIVNDKHSSKVVNFMLDMMCPLITEADAVSQELLDIILRNIIEPRRSQNKHAYNLAKDLLRRTANHIEPYIQTFFNNALMLGKSSESEVSGKLYEVIYELNQISPSVLLAVLPQLEFKLKSSDSMERKQVTKLLAKMFSDPDSDLAVQHKQLWICFLGRYNDIDIEVRRTCVETSMSFIVNHKELVKDVAEHLKQRQHDPDENVRMDVVQAIVNAAKKEFSHVSDDLLECVKERTLDKKFKIRKEALIGLGQIYRRCTMRDDVELSEVQRVAWIRNKVFHAYYQSSMEDRVQVERIFNTSLVPFTLEPEERMRKLYHLYGNLDEHATKALQEVFKSQMNLRGAMRGLLETLNKGVDWNDAAQSQVMQCKAVQLSRGLPEPAKAQEYMKRLIKLMAEDQKVRNHMARLVSNDCLCKKALEHVKEILKRMGNAGAQNYLHTNVKMLLERIAPLMIDSVAIMALVKYVDEAVGGIGDICDEMPDAVTTGMKLLLMLSYVYPGSFQLEEIYERLMAFVKHDDDTACDITLQIFANIGRKLETTHPNIYSSLLPVLQKIIKIGTPRQAKHAVRCIHAICKNSDKIFSQIFEHLKKNMDLDSPNFLTSLVAIGHITQFCPAEFAPAVKKIVSQFIVKELLMQDRGGTRNSAESWCADHLVSEETQAKIQALKMMMRWLCGVKSDANKSATSTLRLLYTLVLHEGDLMEKGKICKAEMSRLRLQAACCILKLVQEPCYAEILTLEQFQTVALLLNDPCYQVRVQFAQKLHKGLISLRLPLQFLSMFCLVANDPLKERRAQVKQFLQANIQRRRDYLKQQPAANTKIFSVLPDYVLPYAIHLLAHDPDLQSHNDAKTLKNIRDCLWFIMEPLITKNESYSYSFYKKMIENIKQTKDAQCPENQDANMKMYAVCDLALNLVLTKTTNFILKDFPAEPLLPAKLFTQPDQSYSNNKVYLPEELMLQQPKGKKVPNIMPGKPAEKKMNIGPSDHSSPSSRASSPPSSPVSSPKSSPTESRPRSKQGTGTKKKAPAKQSAGKKKEVKKRRGRSAPTEEDDNEEDEEEEEEEEDEEEEEEEEEEDDEEEEEQEKKSRGQRGKRKRDDSPSGKSSDRSPPQSSKKSSRRDSAPSSSSSSGRKRGTAAATASGKKGGTQGKITDMFKRTSGGGSRDSSDISGSSTRGKSPSSARSSPKKTIGRGRGRPRKDSLPKGRGQRLAASPEARAGYLKKRAADEEEEESPQPSPAKKAKTMAAQKSVRNAVRNLTKDSSLDSPKSSPHKSLNSSQGSTGSRGGRGRKKESIPSPNSSPSKSSSASSTTNSPRKKKSKDDSPRKVYPSRKNVRRAAPLLNGTSDGEDGTPDSRKSSSQGSASTPRKRASALAKTIEDQGLADLNVKRRTRRK